MATTVITGRDISLSFTGGTDIDAQATSAVLTKTNVRETYQTLDGEAYKTVNVEGTFALEMLADWGKTDSDVCSKNAVPLSVGVSVTLLGEPVTLSVGVLM